MWLALSKKDTSFQSNLVKLREGDYFFEILEPQNSLRMRELHNQQGIDHELIRNFCQNDSYQNQILMMKGIKILHHIEI